MTTPAQTERADFTLRAVLLAVTIHCLWGGNAVAIKWGLEVFPPLTSGFIRFSMAAVCIVAWARWQGRAVWPARHEWPALGALSALFAVQIWAMNLGFDMTSGSVGSVLLAMNPLFAAGFAHLFIRGDRLSGRRLAGLLVAFTGAAVVLAPDSADTAREVAALGNWIILASTALLGARLMLAARLLQEMDEVRVTVWMLLLSLPLFGVPALLTESIAWQHLGWRPVAGLLYQGLVIAGAAFMINAYLMKRYSPTVSVSFNFVSPLAGVGLSIWLLNEPLGAGLLVGMVCVGLGLFLIARSPRDRQPHPPGVGGGRG